MLPYLLAPVRASWLGPEARGAFAFFQSSLVVVAACGTMGVRFAAYALDEKGARRLELPMHRTIAWGLSAGLACALPLSVIASLIMSPWLGASILLCVLFVPGWMRSQLELANSQMLALDGRLSLGLTVASIVEFVLNLATVVTRSLTLVSSVVVTLCAELTRILLAARWRQVDARESSAELLTVADAPQVDGREFSRMSRSYAPGAILPMVAANIDVLIYGTLMPVALVGLYAVAKLGFSLYLPVGAVLEGRVLSGIRDHGLGRTLLRVAALGVAVSLPLSAGAYVLLPALFGAAYNSAMWGVPLACLAGTLRLVYGAMLVGSATQGSADRGSSGSWALIGMTVGGAAVLGVLDRQGVLGHSTHAEALTLGAMLVVLSLAQAAGVVVMASRARLTRPLKIG